MGINNSLNYLFNYLFNFLLKHLFITSNKEKSISTRKCAYCRNVCETIKLCDGCRKRAYCSEACRTADWSIDGQRHINWCINSYECGEEDVDWEIVPVPNKGMGIIAKRYIPTGYRIMADPSYTNPYDHPGKT